MPLRIDTTVPYANACDVAVNERASPPEVEFAADAHGGPERLWFCFRLAAAPPAPAAGQVTLILKHADTMLGGTPVEKLRPVARRPGGAWERLGPPARLDLPDGRFRAVWTLDAPRPWLDLAFCYPYGPPDVDALVRDGGGYWGADTIGTSQAARPIVRLSNGPGEPGSHRPGLYFIARQHSGETPGSWVLDGLLRRLAERKADGPLFWTVPLTNIDGVIQGDYGKDNFPYDLNRAWGTPPMRHEVMVLQRDLSRWKGRCRPVLGLDFHGPGGTESDGAYFYVPDPAEDPDHHQADRAWAERLAQAVGPDFMSPNAARVAKYPSRWTTPNFRPFCRDKLGMCGLCLETPYAQCGKTLMTIDAYREVGRRLADSLVEELAR